MSPKKRDAKVAATAARLDWDRLRRELEEWPGLDLSAAGSAALRIEMERYDAMLQDYRTEMERRGGDAERRAFAAKLSTLLGQVTELIEGHPGLFASTVAQTRPGFISHALSYAACEAAVGASAFADAFPEAVMERARRKAASAQGGLVELEMELPVKARLEAKHIEELSTYVLRVLREPFELVGAATKSGRPPDRLRELLILQLASASWAVLGGPPTTTEGGKFMALCDVCCRHFGISDEGLQDAVKRTFRKHPQFREWAGMPNTENS